MEETGVGKSLFIAEKPSVAVEFAKALQVTGSGTKKDGYIENDEFIVTWCVGHLVTMSYPEAYDPELKNWSLDTLPFIPTHYKYEVIGDVRKQYNVVKQLLNRQDIDAIYYSGDSAREGEYIQRLVRQLAGHNQNAKEYRVWIDSQTKEEILRGIREAKELSAYDALSDSAYARAIEDYLIGINFSRALSIKYSRIVSTAVGDNKYHAIAVGRVMSCVLGMVVERERLIRNTKVISFYSMKALTSGMTFDWKITEKSPYFNTPDNYNNSGLLNRAPVTNLVAACNEIGTLNIVSNEKSVSKKAAPLLFNLAELQSECTKLFKISPSDTLAIAQSLYEKKLTTYPRTDARVLTTAITKVYQENIAGLKNIPQLKPFAEHILSGNLYSPSRMNNTKYVDDSKVADHYAIIPTGQETHNLGTLSQLERQVYILICQRFLSIFYPEAVINKVSLQGQCNGETFVASCSITADPGFLVVSGYKKNADEEKIYQQAVHLTGVVPATFEEREGKSKPPGRYTSGSMILAMENAGNLIEDQELREQIKGSGIGTSATRGEVISKLEKNRYITINKKTQVITPDSLGEIIYDILHDAVPQILNPRYTASWEKGLQGIVDGNVNKETYLSKINGYVAAGVNSMKSQNFTDDIKSNIAKLKAVYPSISTSWQMNKNEVGIACPLCGMPLKISDKGYYCSGYKEGCKFSIWNTIAGKKITDSILKDLIESWTKNETGGGYTKISKKISGFKSKSGKTFEARIQFTQEKAGDYIKASFQFEK